MKLRGALYKKSHHGRNRKRINRGFTLVELVVVMVLLVITAAAATLSIIRWQEWNTFHQENEYAQTLFIAAQNQLCEYSANGRLPEMQQALGGQNSEGKYVYGTSHLPGLSLDLARLKNEEGVCYTLEGIWPQSAGKPDAARYRSTVLSLRTEAGEYERYLDDPTGFKEEDPEGYWVFELLAPHVYDASILNNGAVALELTPEDGQVFALFYSDKKAQLVYGVLENAGGAPSQAGQARLDPDTANIDDRSESSLRPQMVGYYGVDTLSKTMSQRR